MEEATRYMLLSAQLKPGDCVLDIAAGTGEQSMLAARLVGPTGLVLATDISAEMLRVAASRAELEQLTHIRTQVMDAEQLDVGDETFDAAICRNGLMLIPRLEVALGEIHRVLKSGRKLAALVWSAPERNPLHALPLALIAKYTGVGSSNTCFSPGPFSLFRSTSRRHGHQGFQSSSSEVSSRTRIVGTRIPHLARSLLRFWRSGSGTCDWNWGNSSRPPSCVRHRGTAGAPSMDQQYQVDRDWRSPATSSSTMRRAL